MANCVEKYLFEHVGLTNLENLRQRLLEDLKTALSHDEFNFDAYVDASMFARKVYTETRLNRELWLGIKKHFFGNDEIVNFINDRSKKLSSMCLEFLRDRYFSLDCQLPTRNICSFSFETDNISYGLLAEEMLMKYLNEDDSSYIYTQSGKLVLQSIPCFGATPDYLVLDRHSVTNRLSSMFEYVQRAIAIAEVKTTQTPTEFSLSSDSFEEADLHSLFENVYKNKHLVLGFSTTKPTVFTVTKKYKPRVNWILPGGLLRLTEMYEETCQISVHRFRDRKWFVFPFHQLEKRPYVNFLTSSRGKQLLGQCLVFNDNRPDLDRVELIVFYLFLSREEDRSPEYLAKIRCCVPKAVLAHIEFELNKKFYAEYYSVCSTLSK